MELLALAVEILVGLDRPDVAEKLVRATSFLSPFVSPLRRNCGRTRHNTHALPRVTLSALLSALPSPLRLQVKLMSALEDDATLTQLASAQVNVAKGGGKVQEAYYTYQELGEKYAWTARLLNSSAACGMALGRFEEAEKELLGALAQARLAGVGERVR